ncbi:MAG: T9SS type A sorting domain-containing protein [Bacteroidota bacterium]
MKKIILFFLFACNCGFSQDMYKNHQKYWYLRSKLRNDFMKVGTNQGESIPMTFRGKTATAADPNKNAVGGGDLIGDLGIYMAVLATEYKMLKLNNQNTDSVKHELYCALNAVNRLDYNAEPLYGSSYSNSLDGFLIRDDIPGDFVLNNYKHFNYYNTWSGNPNDTWTQNNFLGDSRQVPNTNFTDKGFQSIIPIGQWQTTSVYSENFEYQSQHGSSASAYGNYAMSSDHVISLMYGLRMISEYVDTGANDQNHHFNYGDEAYTSIRDETGVISDRVVKYLKNHNWKIQKPNGSPVSANQGGNAKFNAYALAQIAGIINQPGNGINHWNQFQSPVPTVDQAYHDSHTKGLGFEEFETYAKSPGTTFDIIVQTAELTSACQCLFSKIGGNVITMIEVIMQKIWKWLGTIFGWLLNIIINIINYVTPIQWNNTTLLQSIPNATVLNLNASRLGERIKYQQDYSLLTSLLYQGQKVSDLDLNLINTYNSVLSRTSDILNSAPCDGPRNFTEGHVYSNGASTISPSYDVLEWSSTSLIEHPNALGADQIDHVPGSAPDTWGLQSGEYNGLDYMLYHNLYYLYKQSLESEQINTIDLRDRFVNYSLPLTNGQGTQQNPLTIGAFEHIIANGIVNNNAKINFVAGKQFGVIYGQNYDILPGADVTVEIYDYNCSNNNYLSPNAMRNASTNPDTNAVYGPIASNEKLHEVIYQPDPNSQLSKNKTKQEVKSRQYINKQIVNLNDHLMIYPNPNSGIFSIKIDSNSDDEKYSVFIYDVMGKEVNVYENISTVNKEIAITNTNLADGSYLIKIIDNKSGKQYMEKLIINKNEKN